MVPSNSSVEYGLWWVSQTKALSEHAQRGRSEGQLVLPGEPLLVGFPPAHTHYRRSLYAERRYRALERWEFRCSWGGGGDSVISFCSCNSGFFRCRCMPKCCIHNVGAFSVICAQESLWKLVFCLLDKGFMNLGVHLGRNLLRNSSLVRMEAWGRKGSHVARQEKSMCSCPS